MTYERGALQEFEVVWASGHSEVIRAHQVSYQGGFGLVPLGAPEVVQFHGEIDGQWLLILRALGSDLRSIRNVTQTEARA